MEGDIRIMKNTAGRKLHMTWRYNDVKGFGDNDEVGVAKFYYGENLVTSPVATEVIEIEIENVWKAEELLAFIKAVSTQQWNDGYKAAGLEMENVLMCALESIKGED
jgi:hypothetical protein